MTKEKKNLQSFESSFVQTIEIHESTISVKKTFDIPGQYSTTRSSSFDNPVFHELINQLYRSNQQAIQLSFHPPPLETQGRESPSVFDYSSI